MAKQSWVLYLEASLLLMSSCSAFLSLLSHLIVNVQTKDRVIPHPATVTFLKHQNVRLAQVWVNQSWKETPHPNPSSPGSHLRLRVQTGRPEHKARWRTLDECQLERELELTHCAVAPQMSAGRRKALSPPLHLFLHRLVPQPAAAVKLSFFSALPP